MTLAPGSAMLTKTLRVLRPQLISILFGLACACFLIATAAMGQPISLLSGEHPSFSRIVLVSRTPFEWRLQEEGLVVRVSVPGREIALDTAALFWRIPRTRVSAARLEQGDLVFEKACPCPVNAFVDRPGVLVLDFHDPETAATESEEQSQELLIAPLARAEQGEADEAAVVVDPLRLVKQPQASPFERVQGELAALAGRALAERLANRVGANEALGQRPSEHDVVRALAERISEALTRGVVRAAAPAPNARARGEASSPALPLAEIPQIRIAAPEDEPLAPPDSRSPSDGGVQEPPRPDVDPCPPAPSWSFLQQDVTPDFAETQAQLYQELYGEFDRPNPETARRLVWHYLAWGLGAEARQLLALPNLSIPDHDLLAAAADVIDGVSSNRTAAFAQLRTCTGPVGLLAAFASLEPFSREEVGSRVVSFLELPAPLAEVLGERFIRQLLALDERESANLVVTALKSRGFFDPLRLQLLEAEIDRMRGDLALAAARVAEAAKSDVEAFRLQLELALQAETVLDNDVLANAVTIAEAHRHTREGIDLALLASRHLARSGQPGAALSVLDRAQNWPAATGLTEALASLRGEAWSAALNLPDREFLALVFSRLPWHDSTFPAPLWPALRDRLAAFGLDDVIAQNAPRDEAEPGQSPAATAERAPIPHLNTDPALVEEGKEGSENARVRTIERSLEPPVAAGVEQSAPSLSPAPDNAVPQPEGENTTFAIHAPLDPMQESLRQLRLTEELRARLRELGLTR